jgi:glycosyltransferase involved in cell wall biosynthesis
MKVLIFHPTLLPPKDYGGVERVVLWLAKGLKERGHDVQVAAFAGSKLPTGVDLIPIPEDQTSPAELLKRLPPGLDLVHFMAPPGDDGFLSQLPCGHLLTVHGNGKPGEVFPRNTVFLSADHAKRHEASEYVYNGIDPEELVVAPSPASARDSYLFLSKTSWSVKNVRGAIRLARKAGVGLKIAGGRRPLLQRALCAITPGMSWIGPVNGREKAELFSRAKALLFPVLWDEPFGLVVAEALMSGTPVIASPRGSMPELVSGEVGALPDSEEEWIEILRQGPKWSPEACRERAMRLFHYRAMAESYEKVYTRILSGKMLHSVHPRRSRP